MSFCRRILKISALLKKIKSCRQIYNKSNNQPREQQKNTHGRRKRKMLEEGEKQKRWMEKKIPLSIKNIYECTKWSEEHTNIPPIKRYTNNIGKLSLLHYYNFYI